MKTQNFLVPLTNPVNTDYFIPSSKVHVGKVYGVVTKENTPTKKMYLKAGGPNGIGSVFYKDYEISKDEEGNYSDIFLDGCDIALPKSQNTPYPLIDELVIIDYLPSAASQEIYANQKYWSGVIGIYNNPQHNSQPSKDKYRFKYFKAFEDIRNLVRFEGDNIIQGRKGNSIRFSSTVQNEKLSEWSKGEGDDGDPIMIISNGHNIDKSIPFHIEKINQEYSSIYLTSTQQIPLIPDRNKSINPITAPINVSDYYGPQVIVNGDRIVINSKKDDVMLFASNNIELTTNNIINLNATERVHINSNNIILGTTKGGKLAFEPLVLGIQMVSFLSKLLSKLSNFASSLQSAKSSPEGSDLVQVQLAAESLNTFLVKEMDENKLINNLLSKQNKTV
jgi:hypothetical protein